MEKLAFKRRIGQPRSSIELIPDDWMADEGQMHANLMRASGLDRNLEQCGVGKSLDNVEMRHRWSPGTHNGHPLPVLGVAANGRVDDRLPIRD
jgi:hypothetical protein